MVKQFFKKKSKRVSCSKRYKIEKKIRQHNKKVKKAAAKKGVSKRKKDITVPNSCPFKDEILKEAEERKQRLEKEREKQKKQRKKEREKMLSAKRNLESLVKDANKRSAEFDKKKQVKGKENADYAEKPLEGSLKAYYKEFKKVIQAADVILQVLDARDPLGSRCPQVEETVLEAGSDKKLVLILNKIDLVPKENVEAWLKYLRNEFPTVAFKSSTQNQRNNLAHSRVPVQHVSTELLNSSRCLGADMLLKLLGNYCRNQDIRTAITVGVVGFPNTGKSSLINSLKRSKTCNVGATPGITKSMQEVQLDKHVKLLDSPGIVMAQGTSDAAIILRNCVKVESLTDPILPVMAILKRCPKDQIIRHYRISDFKDVSEFLSILALRLGKLKKRGVPDTIMAARALLNDWNQGRITYYTHPPEVHRMPAHISADIVQQMGKAFDIDALLQDEMKELSNLKLTGTNDIVVESFGPTEMQTEEDIEEKDVGSIEEEKMDEDSDAEVDGEELKDVTVSCSKSKAKSLKSTRQKSDPSDLGGNLQLNKKRKQAFKKMKKQRRKADVVAGELSTALSSALDTIDAEDDDDYDVERDFT